MPGKKRRKDERLAEDLKKVSEDLGRAARD